MHIALILGGGDGQRFWPLSRKQNPKQFLTLMGTNALIRETFLRLRSFLDKQYIFIVSREDLREKFFTTIPDFSPSNYISEPCKKNTLAAIALAVTYIEQRYPKSSLFVCPADHYIPSVESFQKTLLKGLDIITHYHKLLCIGIKPSRPEKEYGYIRRGKQITHETYSVKQFIEKPSEERAQLLINEGQCLWNSGIFIWNNEDFLRELQAHQPTVYTQMKAFAHAIGTPNENTRKAQVFDTLPSTSIDYGVLEKTTNLYCIETDMNWDDLGSWGSLRRLHKKNPNDNLTLSRTWTERTRNCTIYSENLFIVTLGLESLYIIHKDDTLFIAHETELQSIKSLLESLEHSEYIHYL